MALTRKEREILLDDQTSATVLLVLSAELLGPEMLQWDPATIRMELEEATASKLSDATLNKLMAAIELVTTDGFYRDLPTFIRLCNTLSHGTLNPEVFDPADAGEIAWGITEALLIWPPNPQDEEPFDDKIVKYIGQALQDEGIMTPPDILQLGLLPKDTWSEAQMAYADDPQMFSMIYDIERAKTADIDRMVKQRLSRVLQTLSELNLQTGDAQASAKKLLAALKQADRESSERKPLNAT